MFSHYTGRHVSLASLLLSPAQRAGHPVSVLFRECVLCALENVFSVPLFSTRREVLLASVLLTRMFSLTIQVRDERQLQAAIGVDKLDYEEYRPRELDAPGICIYICTWVCVFVSVCV